MIGVSQNIDVGKTFPPQVQPCDMVVNHKILFIIGFANQMISSSPPRIMTFDSTFYKPMLDYIKSRNHYVDDIVFHRFHFIFNGIMFT